MSGAEGLRDRSLYGPRRMRTLQHPAEEIPIVDIHEVHGTPRALLEAGVPRVIGDDVAGQITPRNKDEVRALDNAGFAPIEVPLEVVMHLEPRWLSDDRTQAEKTVITLAAELERSARGGRQDHAVLNHLRKRINAFQRHPSALSDDDVHALAHDITEAIQGGRRP